MIRPLILALSVCLLGACRQTRPLVGVIPKPENHFFWEAVHAGALKAAQEFNLDIEWVPPAPGPAGQVSAMEAMIGRKPVGIALAPVDGKLLVPVVERATQAGIPVAVFESGVATEQRITFIGSDHREAGRQAARRLGEVLLSEGEVAIIAAAGDQPATVERTASFAAELKARFPSIRIVDTIFTGGDRAQAMSATRTLLAAHPGLRGIFADGDSTGVGVANALSARGNSRIMAVVFGNNDQLVAHLQDRVIDALLVENPFRMGYEAVKSIALRSRGQAPARTIDSGVYLVTRIGLEQPDVLELLHPDVQKWLSGAAKRR